MSTTESLHPGGVDWVGLHANLHYLITQWDPLGVADIAPDECDCMLAPLLAQLLDGAGATELSEFLWYELLDHHGVDPEAKGVDAMANRLVAWWRYVGPDMA